MLWAAIPSGMEGGGTRYSGLLILLVSLLPLGDLKITRHKCCQSLYVSSLLITHTLVDPHCWDPPKSDTCTHGQQTFWAAENRGQTSTRQGSECPKGEKWVCSERALGGGIQEDLVKEQLVSPNSLQPMQNILETPVGDT